MLKVFTIDQSQEWDEIVRTFDKYDVYYLSGYVKAFQLHGDGEPLLLFWGTPALRGINVVMKRDIAADKHFAGRIEEGTYYDLATPYGYGSWIFEGDESQADDFIAGYTDWCKENRIVSEFVRFHPVLENREGICSVLYDPILLGNTVAIELDDEEAIWARYTSKNRSHIRVARKEGVTVEVSTSDEAFDQFRKIYETTMDHDDATDYYYFDKAFFDSIRDDLAGNYEIYTAYLGDVAIASAIMLFAGKYMNYHLSGQLFEYRRYSGTSLLLHEAAVRGCKEGYEWLHLGGGLGAQEGPLYDFKKSFYKKGEDKQFYIGKKILDPDAYQKLLDMREDDLQEGFFPQYRG